MSHESGSSADRAWLNAVNKKDRSIGHRCPTFANSGLISGDLLLYPDQWARKERRWRSQWYREPNRHLAVGLLPLDSSGNLVTKLAIWLQISMLFHTKAANSNHRCCGIVTSRRKRARIAAMRKLLSDAEIEILLFTGQADDQPHRVFSAVSKI